MDQEELLFKEEGIGHIVVPCVTFQSDEVHSAKGGRRTPQKSREVPTLADTPRSKSSVNALPSLGRASTVKDGLGLIWLSVWLMCVSWIHCWIYAVLIISVKKIRLHWLR